MKKIVFLALVLMLLSISMLGTRLLITVSGSTAHHVYLGDSIQEAINSAQSGGMIFVHSGTYYEHVVVNKTVVLIGEDKHDTIVDGNFTGTGIHITVNNVTISGFTIQNSGEQLWVQGGIFVDHSSGNNVSNNIITNNGVGMFLQDSNSNTISGNNIFSNKHSGIGIERSYNNTLIGNTVFSNNYRGIVLWGEGGYNTLIGNNVSSNNAEGIHLARQCSHNTVVGNTISDNLYGIHVSDSSNNMIFHNNLINNTNQAFVHYLSTNAWDNGYPSGGNYWSDYTGSDTNGDGIGDRPYVIQEEENNQDNYPLMSPWSPTWAPKTPVPFWMQWWFWTIVIAVIASLAVDVYFLKKRKPQRQLLLQLHSHLQTKTTQNTNPLR